MFCKKIGFSAQPQLLHCQGFERTKSPSVEVSKAKLHRFASWPQQEHKTLSTSGTWYFLHGGSEESVTAIVPAETVLASTPAVVHGWCMKWKETASGTKPYLDQASSERTCARGTAYMLSEPGARLYETFWTGPAQPLADPQSLSFTAPSGQILKATVLVPKLPLTEEAPQYFSAIWFEACETEEEFTTVSS